MTKKRRRKRPAGARPASGTTPASPDEPAPPAEEPPSSRRDERPQRGWGAARPSPYPPLGVTLARGLSAVGTSWPTLVAVFVSALVTWIAFVAIGEESNPRFMVTEMAVPPVNIFLTDISTMFSFAGSAVGTLGVMVGLGVLRAATFGAVLLMIDRSVRAPDATLAATARRFPKLFVALLAIYIVEVTVAVVVQQAVGLIGSQFFLLGVIATLYFLAMVPVVAAAEDASAQESFRRGFRAARLPGTRHLGLVMAYAILMMTLLLIMPGAVLAPATPTFTTWLLVLLASFVHASVLAGLHYRWLVVRDEVPAPARPAVRSGAARARGRRP